MRHNTFESSRTTNARPALQERPTGRIRSAGPAKAVRILAATLAALAAMPMAAQHSRITDVIDNSRTVTLTGHVNARAMAGTDQGEVDAAFPLNDVIVTLKPSGEQQTDLTALLAAQQDPSSPDYRNWLSPAEFADRFGLGQSDLGQIAAWLEAEGFTVRGVAASRNWMAFSGTAAAAQGAFGVEIHRYLTAGESHFATVSEPHVPAAIAGLISSFRGFDDFLPQPPRAAAHAKNALRPDYTSGSGAHYLAPADAATIYNFGPLYQKGYDGTGQTLAVVGQSAINLSDIENFRTIFGLAKNDPKLVTVPNLTTPGIVAGDVIESDLDLEWAGAVARGANLIFVYTSNAFNSLQYAVSQNLAPVISISYGTCETGAASEAVALRQIAQQANAEGITVLSASGDTGAFACDASSVAVATHGVSVTLPASIPEVTAVGGTEFSEGSGTWWSTSNNAGEGSALSYIPEAGWNETSIDGSLGASGGGPSAQFAKPSWQAGAGVPADGARDVPDIAMAADADHDGAIICTNGGCAGGLSGAMVVGGTSVATPIFAGIVALLNHYETGTGSLSKGGLGNVNPTLYALAQSYGDAFHDVTSGNSIVPCRAGTPGCATGSFGYEAGPGYDLVTGLGSVSAYALATDWALFKSVPLALSSVTVSPSSLTGGVAAKITVILTAVAPSGGVTVPLSSSSAAFPVPASIVVPAGQSTASVNATAISVTAAASVTVTATCSGSTKTATVSVVPAVLPSLSSVAVSPAGMAGGGSATVTVTLSTAAPTGGATVALSSSSKAFPVPASVVVPAGAIAASVTVQTATVAASTVATITATYNGGAKTASITITPAVVSSLSSVAVSPASVAGGASGTVTVTLNAAAPTGGATVALSSNSKAFPVPADVVVPAGAMTASVTVQATAVTVSTSATITATYNGSAKTASITITITPAVLPSLSSVAVTSASMTGGASTTVTVTLSAAAPTGGATVALSSNSAAFPVPAGVVVPVGAKTASVTVQAAAVTTSTSATITASYNGVSKAAGVAITPSALPAISSVTISPANTAGSAMMALTVLLSGAAPPAGALVTLSSNSAAFPVPGSVTVLAGTTGTSLLVEAATVKSSTLVTVTASYNKVSVTAGITLAPAGIPTLAALAVTPSTVRGGSDVTITVTLSGPAPTGGAAITFTSNNAAFPLPASAAMAAGMASGSLQVQTKAVSASTTATITVSSGGTTRTAVVTITP